MRALRNEQAAIDALTDAAATDSTTQKTIHIQTAQVYATLALAEAIEAAAGRHTFTLGAGQ